VGEGEIGGLGVHPGLRHRDGGLGAAGTEPTCQLRRSMSAYRGEADSTRTRRRRVFLPSAQRFERAKDMIVKTWSFSLIKMRSPALSPLHSANFRGFARYAKAEKNARWA
jgi:hypothetical protein